MANVKIDCTQIPRVQMDIAVGRLYGYDGKGD